MGVVTLSSRTHGTPTVPDNRTAPTRAPRAITWPALEASGVIDAVVTTRHGGVSTGPWASANLGLHVGDDPEAVLANRHRAAAHLELTLDDLVFCRQTHSTRVATVTAADAGRGTRSEDDALEGIDAVVTTDPGVGLVILVADCVPIVLVDPTARVMGIVHAGWRGTAGDIVGTTVDTMVDLGAEPHRLVAAFGPSVPAERYQVGAEVAEALEQRLGPAPASPDGTPVLQPDVPDADRTRRWRCDLRGANASLLVAKGIRAENLHDSGHTSMDPDFFSDRLARPCGRFAAMARLTPLTRAGG